MVNGGGKGVMEASAKGCAEAGGHSVGAGIPELKESVDNRVYKEYVVHRAPIRQRVYGKGGYEDRGVIKVFFPGSIGTDTELHLAIVDLYVRKKRNLKSAKPDPAIAKARLILVDIDGFFTRGYPHGDGTWHEGFIPDLKKRIAAGREYPDLLDLVQPVKNLDEILQAIEEQRNGLKTGLP